MAQFIGLQKLVVGGLKELSVDRSVDRQRSEIRPLGLRSTGPVDRASGTESSFSVGRPIRSTGVFQRAEALWRSTGSVDRPSNAQRRARCTRRSTVAVGRLQAAVDRPGRPAEAWSGNLRDLKLSHYGSNKFP